MTTHLNILVLGGYGLIGTALCRRFATQGHRVVVAGRSQISAQHVLPDLPFQFCDMGQMQNASDWNDLLIGVDVAINCTGALQDSPQDNLETLHHHAVAALGAAAAQTGVRIVQISAAGADASATTVFMASKARGDAALLTSGAVVNVLRPGLVLAQPAYGGTNLLRMLAACPVVQLLATPDVPIQTVGLDQVADSVEMAVNRALPDGSCFDLVEDQAHSLAEVVAAHRHALGFPKARWRMTVPDMMLLPIRLGADALGRLGWRSPLRSTAIEVLQQGVTGDPAPWRDQHRVLRPMRDTLAGLELDSAHRLQARMGLLMPLAVATLALFWALSGVIGMLQATQAAQHLTAIGWPFGVAVASVVFWACVDLALAAGVMWRRQAKRACLAMIAVSVIYLVSATLLTPWMWADPLGPMVKVFPGILLAALTHVLLESR